MEPILQNPLFPSILNTWKFFTSFHDYLDLPDIFSEVSLYEFHSHIVQTKFTTAFTAQFIQALVSKAKTPQKTKKPWMSALTLAKSNKYNFFDELANISAYELGWSQVVLIQAWRDLETIPQLKPFESLTEKEKFTYLSMLTTLITTSEPFKKHYMETLKTEYAAANEKAEKSTKLEIQKQFLSKINHSTVLGKDGKGNLYFYLAKIGDSILKCEPKTKVWKRIKGQEDIKKEILDKIIENSNLIGNEELDLLEQVNDIWNRISWNMNYTAFEKDHKLFKINEEAPKLNKLKIMSQKLHKLDYEYTKFISDCFNFRWASKERRIAFHKQIDQAETMQDLLSCFSSFFDETKCSSQRKENTLDFYDTNLETEDQKPNEFKSVFLRANYLYCKGVYASTSNPDKYDNGLYNQIKSVLAESKKFENLHFEYLFIFVESMLGIIKDLYPSAYQRRLKQIQTMKESQKKMEEQLKKSKSSKLTKNGRSISSDHGNTSDQSSDSESETAEEKKQSVRPAHGKRLRQKVKINYQITDSNSRVRKNKLKSSKKIVGITKKQSKRNAKGHKKTKMILDSDSEDDFDSQMSDDETESSEESGGLNLDKYQYEQTSPKVNLRRNLRN